PRDRRDVRRTIPAVEFDRVHGFGIALRKGIFRLRQSAHQKPPILSRFPRKSLCDRERCNNRIVFLPASRDDTRDNELRTGVTCTDFEHLTGLYASAAGEIRA